MCVIFSRQYSKSATCKSVLQDNEDTSSNNIYMDDVLYILHLELVLLLLVSGTICHSTSRLQTLCLSSAVASRLISLGAAFRDTLTVVVPEK